MYIARDKDGKLCLFYDKPVRNEEYGTFDTPDYRPTDAFYDMTEEDDWADVPEKFKPKDDVKPKRFATPWVDMCEELFPEVTWENSPLELVLTTK